MRRDEKRKERFNLTPELITEVLETALTSQV
jgi:hypothetical protein